MVSISPLEINLTGHQWASLPDWPKLTIRVTATKNGKDICNIHYMFNDGNGPLEFDLNEDLVDSITTQMSLDESNINWDADKPQISHLLYNLQSIMDTELNEEDLHTMASSGAVIFQSVAGPSSHGASSHDSLHPRQSLINVFIAQVSIYLVFCDLLYREKLWSVMPVSFEMPFDCMDGRMLTESAMSFMRYPLRSLKIMGSPFVRELEWILISFFNSWSNNYMLGDALETTDMVLSLITSISEATLAQIDARAEAGLGRMEELIAQKQMDSMEMTQNLEGALSNRIGELERQVDKMAEMLAEIRGKLEDAKVDGLIMETIVPTIVEL